jgi:hypothetical protein
VCVFSIGERLLVTGGDEMTEKGTRPRAAAGRAEDGLRTPRRCALYLPGHTVHFIQARLGWEEPESREPARLVAIEGNLLVVRVGSKERRYRNHEPERLGEAAERFGPEVMVQESLHLLLLPSDTGDLCFCIARAHEPWRECVAERPSGPLDAESAVDLLERFGGFYARSAGPEATAGRDVPR